MALAIIKSDKFGPSPSITHKRFHFEECKPHSQDTYRGKSSKPIPYKLFCIFLQITPIKHVFVKNILCLIAQFLHISS